MDRKEFIKFSCNACMLGAAAMLMPSLQGCSPAVATAVFKAEPVNNKVEIPLQLFEKNALQIVRLKNWQYDIAVQKNKDGNYNAVLLQCTHMENQLTVSQNGFTCSLHGSTFTNNGDVVKGPAEIPLKKYKTTINNNNLIISI